MGVEYSVEIKVGYVFDLYELIRPFEKIKPEESHLEPRWDQKTGKEIKPEKVIDSDEEVFYEFDGTYETEEELLEDIASRAGCHYHVYGDFVSGDVSWVIFGLNRPALKQIEEDFDINHNLRIGGAVTYQSVVAQAKALEKLGNKLKSLGIKKVGKPRVVQTYSVS